MRGGRASNPDSDGSSEARRFAMAERAPITCHALRVKQNDAHPVYLFALTAEQLQNIADISRLERTSGTLVGYQRGIAKQHVDNIAQYLNSDDPVFPNAVIIALPSSTRFDGVLCRPPVP